jgi:hypothetical protein
MHKHSDYADLTGTPLGKRFNSRPVAVALCFIRNNNAACLDVGAFKVSQQAMFVTDGRWDAIVANQRLRKDENLPTVTRISHPKEQSVSDRKVDARRHAENANQLRHLRERTIQDSRRAKS